MTESFRPASEGAASVSRLPVADRLIVALDIPSPSGALGLANQLKGVCSWVKVGMELYYSGGNPVVTALRAEGFKVFLDLKLHDIPNTVASSVRSVSQAGASLLTVHAGGGAAMLQAAAAAAQEPGAPTLLAVTVLTSMDRDQLLDVGVEGSPLEHSLKLAKLSKRCGFKGFVCSPQEVHELRLELGQDALLVTPGIRPLGTDLGDQRRTASPEAALHSGASMLVVGRPITRAQHPRAAAEAILREMEEAGT